MFLGSNTASEIFIPRHFLFALPLSKVCAMHSAQCAALCGAVCKFVKSFLFVVLTLPHQTAVVHFLPKKNRNKTYTQTQEKWNKINWQFEHSVLAARFEWDSGTGRQNKSKQTKHMKQNRSTDQNRILAIANAATARKLSVRFRFRFRLPELALTTWVGSKQHPILTSGWRYFWQ